jgi:hypothetical protein
MSTPHTEQSVYAPSQDRPSPNKTAQQRLAEIRLALQRQLRRKGTAIEVTAMDHAALMMLRAEMAMLDPNADSNDIVRLSNASRRATANFERVAGIDSTKKRKQRDMRSVEKELAQHVR